MNDFQKAKIGFALALLATAFAIYPLLETNLDVGFELFGGHISIGLTYTSTVAFLGAAVYVFALDFITSKPWRWVQQVGTGFYVAALLIPPLALLLYLGTLVVGALLTAVDSDRAISIIQSIVGGLSGAFAVILGLSAFKRIIQRDRYFEAKAWEVNELTQLTRARELLISGFPDMAVLEALKAVESALRVVALRLTKLRRPAGFGRILHELRNADAISESMAGELEALRKVRNKLVHEKLEMNIETAERLISNAEKVLVALRGYDDTEMDGLEN